MRKYDARISAWQCDSIQIRFVRVSSGGASEMERNASGDVVEGERARLHVEAANE